MHNETQCIKEALKELRNREKVTEADVRQEIYTCIKPALDQLGVDSCHECNVNGGKVDAVYGRVLVEYKAPAFEDFEKAKEQLGKYIEKYAKKTRENINKYIGVIISDRIAFVTWDGRSWTLEGPYDPTKPIIDILLRVLREQTKTPQCQQHC